MKYRQSELLPSLCDIKGAVLWEQPGLPPLLSLGQAYFARRNDIQPFVYKVFRLSSGMP